MFASQAWPQLPNMDQVDGQSSDWLAPRRFPTLLSTYEVIGEVGTGPGFHRSLLRVVRQKPISG